MNVSLSFAEGPQYVALAVVLYIVWLAWRARGGRGVAPTRKEWEGLRGQILTFDRNAAHLSTLSVTTRRALSLVLSSRAERPRIEGIPSTIGLLEGFGDGVSRQLRALSTMAVMTGLCATAIVFYVTFSETAQRDGTKPLDSLLAGVASVYLVNFAAIVAGIWIYWLQIHWRKQSDGIVELATDVLSDLEEIPQLAPDPAILAALQQQHEHFERWSSGFFDKQLSSIQ